EPPTTSRPSQNTECARAMSEVGKDAGSVIRSIVRAVLVDKIPREVIIRIGPQELGARDVIGVVAGFKRGDADSVGRPADGVAGGFQLGMAVVAEPGVRRTIGKARIG